MPELFSAHASGDISPAAPLALKGENLDFTHQVRAHLDGSLDKQLVETWRDQIRIIPRPEERRWVIPIASRYTIQVMPAAILTAVSEAARRIANEPVRVELEYNAELASLEDQKIASQHDENRRKEHDQSLFRAEAPKLIPTFDELVGKPFSRNQIAALKTHGSGRMSDRDLAVLISQVPQLVRDRVITKSQSGFIRTVIQNGSWRSFMPDWWKPEPVDENVKAQASNDAGGALANAPEETALSVLPTEGSRPVRTPLCVEFDTIFLPDHCKADYLSVSRSYEDVSGSVQQKITIGKSSGTDRTRGVLKVVHQKAFYYLLYLWNRQEYRTTRTKGGLEVGEIISSPFEITEALAGSWGTENYSWVKKILADLKSIPIHSLTIRPGAATRDYVFYLLDGLECDARYDSDGSALRKAGRIWILLSPLVTSQIRKTHELRRISYQTYSQLDSDYARLAYPYIDLQLRGKNDFHIKAIPLLHRFGISPWEKRDPNNPWPSDELIVSKRYLLKKLRGQLVRMVADKLHGKEHSTGGIIHTWGNESKSQDDWILNASLSLDSFSRDCATCLSQKLRRHLT
jgi:hypothetical protein